VLRVALKDLLARKRRLVTTSIAIVLGIAFLTGTQLLSGSLSDSIKSLVADVYDGIDAVVQSPQVQESPFGPALRNPVPSSLVDEVLAVDGVRTAEGVIEATGTELVGGDGKVVGGGFGPPTITYNWILDEQLRTGRLVDGRGPLSDSEIALDFRTAERLDARVGDTVRLATLQQGTEEFTLVGLVGLGEEGDRSSGARVMFFTTPTAQRLSNQPGQFNFVWVAARDGLSQAELADRLAAALPGQQVLTGDAFSEQNQEDISQFVDILGTFVSVFGWIALFVAVFIIYNTFSIIVTQRTRETALLRAVGARRSQVVVAGLLEAVVVGLIASVLGLLAGMALASLLLAAVGSIFTVANRVPSLGVDTVVFALAVGVGITLVSSLIPTLRSSKIPPIAALTETAVDRSGVSRARKAWGAALVLGGLALLGAGLADTLSPPIAWVGAGAALLLVSVAVILGPLIAAPVSRLLAAPFSVSGRLAGRLAGENAARNPRRTSASAAALTVGVTVVVVIAIVAASIKESFDRTIAQSVRADFVVATASIASFGAIPRGLPDRVAELPGVAAASPTRFTFLRLLDAAATESGTPREPVPPGLVGAPDDAPDGEDTFALGIDPSTWFEVVDSGDLQGDPADLTAGTMAANAGYANERGWRLGDRIPVYFGASGRQELTLALLFDADVGQGDLYLPLATLEGNVLPIFDVDAQIYVRAEDGADLDRLRRDLEALVADIPTVVVQDLNEFIEAQTGPLNTIVAIVYGLLGLALLIALIGIANTLSLSVMERTRELGLLRAVGMSRRQLRSLVRTESAIIATFGTLIGLVIGILFSIALTVTVASQTPDLFTYHLPVGQLVVITLVAALAGVVAAWFPARRAARMDVLAAIATE
jgi:putative ABC transport system permease protein